MTKTYSLGEIEVAALRGVDLTIGTGEMVAVVGPSGSGKSTLMHIIGCLDVPTAGPVRRSPATTSAASARATSPWCATGSSASCSSSSTCSPTCSAWRNVELPLVYAGMAPAERRERALAALDQVGLGDRADHRPGELSGGQQQRVAVARALVTEPELILADEPTGNLDSTSTADVLALLDELHDAGRTVVLITHEDDVAARAGRTVHIRDGEVVDPRPAPVAADTGSGPAMRAGDVVRTATEAIRSHRLRSALTTLGILIGITAVILTVGLGDGARAQVQDEVERARHQHPGDLAGEQHLELGRAGRLRYRLDPDR